VAAGGVNLNELADAGTLAASAANAFYYNASLEATFIKIFDTQASIAITVLF